MHGFNPHSDPLARQIHDANEQLRGIHDQLREANQPPDLRAALHAGRAERARATAWGVRLVLGLAAAWVVLSLVFGRAGQRVFGALLSFAWDAAGVLLVLGGVVWVGGAVLRAGRALGGADRQAGPRRGGGGSNP